MRVSTHDLKGRGDSRFIPRMIPDVQRPQVEAIFGLPPPVTENTRSRNILDTCRSFCGSYYFRDCDSLHKLVSPVGSERSVRHADP
jgi:hypothetical protein